jgi:hypothetical protein
MYKKPNKSKRVACRHQTFKNNNKTQDSAFFPWTGMMSFDDWKNKSLFLETLVLFVHLFSSPY